MYSSPFAQELLPVALDYFESGVKLMIGEAIVSIADSYFIPKFNNRLMALMPNMNVSWRMIARVDHEA